MKKIALLGSTGSIGTSTLAVLDNLKEEFQISASAQGRIQNCSAGRPNRFDPIGSTLKAIVNLYPIA